jgi:hypothetical protein
VTDVALLTNMRTLNLGNQLLSTELVELFDRLYPVVRPFHRLSEVFAANLPSDDLDRWRETVGREAERARTAPRPPVGPASHTVTVGRRGGSVTGRRGSPRHRAAQWVRWHTPVRRYFEASEGRAARSQLASVAACDEVVWNPAGELLAIGFPRSRFFEVALAHAAGRPFAVVNFSYEPTPPARALGAEVLPHAARVFARDEASAGRLVDDGVPAERVSVVADAGLLYEPPTAAVGGRGIGLAIHGGLDAGSTTAWKEAISGLAGDATDVEFVSNEHQTDVRVAETLRGASARFRIGPEISDFRDFAAHLATFDVVVTGRFHTAVLCSVLGVPWVGLEPNTRRIRDGLVGVVPDDQRLGMDDEGWPARLVAAVHEAVPPSQREVERLRGTILDAYTRSFPLTQVPQP